MQEQMGTISFSLMEKAGQRVPVTLSFSWTAVCGQRNGKQAEESWQVGHSRYYRASTYSKYCCVVWHQKGSDNGHMNIGSARRQQLTLATLRDRVGGCRWA